MYLNGINGVEQLGKLPTRVSDSIIKSKFIIDTVLKRGDKKKHLKGVFGLGRANNSKKISFAQIVKQYNPGITNDEIRSWVWYKRSQGVAMNGWNKYFINKMLKKTH